MKKRIIIFDDDVARRDSLPMLLNMCKDMECVGAFSNAANAINDIKLSNPDLILMDIDMPQVNGINGTKIIKASFPDMPIIIQTVFDDNENIFEALKSGANGYLLKKTAPDKLIEQIQEALNGGAPMTGSVASKVLKFFSAQPQSSYDLTERESQILKLLVDGYSYKMIANESNISYFTVCNHIKKIYQKLHVNSATEAVKLALQQKLV